MDWTLISICSLYFRSPLRPFIVIFSFQFQFFTSIHFTLDRIVHNTYIQTYSHLKCVLIHLLRIFHNFLLSFRNICECGGVGVTNVSNIYSVLLFFPFDCWCQFYSFDATETAVPAATFHLTVSRYEHCSYKSHLIREWWCLIVVRQTMRAWRIYEQTVCFMDASVHMQPVSSKSTDTHSLSLSRSPIISHIAFRIINETNERHCYGVMGGLCHHIRWSTINVCEEIK